jgi:hypothetical protein
VESGYSKPKRGRQQIINPSFYNQFQYGIFREKGMCHYQYTMLSPHTFLVHSRKEKITVLHTEGLK